MVDIYVFAYAERAGVRGPNVENLESRVYIQEDYPIDDYDYPNA
jgi:hypothetical protein